MLESELLLLAKKACDNLTSFWIIDLGYIDYFSLPVSSLQTHVIAITIPIRHPASIQIQDAQTEVIQLILEERWCSAPRIYVFDAPEPQVLSPLLPPNMLRYIVNLALASSYSSCSYLGVGSLTASLARLHLLFKFTLKRRLWSK